VVLGRFGARIGREQTLFDKGEAVHPSPGEVAATQTMGGTPRLRVPQRDPIEMHGASLDELLESDHPVRMVWACVCGLDLGRWLTTIKAVEGVEGRDATDPRLLVALWIYATIDGVGKAETAKGGGSRQAIVASTLCELASEPVRLAGGDLRKTFRRHPSHLNRCFDLCSLESKNHTLSG